MIEDSAHAPPRRSHWSVPTLISFGAAACIGVVLWQLLYNGPFRWHVALPQFWQGGIEALVLIGLLAALQLLPRRGWRIALSVLLAALYLRRHAVDAALLVDVCYFEIIFAAGAGVARLSGGDRPGDVIGYLRAFLLGFCTWSACAWVLSAFGAGSVFDLRALTLVLLIAAVAVRSTPACAFVERRVAAMPAVHRAAAAALSGWFLVLFAHSAVTLGFDSLWYGLRGDRVLVGVGSAFAAQGLVSPVYYFPKVYELFLVPLSGFGSASVILGIGIGMLALLGATAWDLMCRLGVHDTRVRLAGVALVVTLPAAANIALEAKPDVFSAFVLAFAWTHAAIFVRTRQPAPLLWLIALLALSTQAKLTAIPYAAALFATTAFASVITQRNVPAPSASTAELRVAGAFLCLALVTCAFAIARTLLLAGVPMIGPDPLLKLWLALGFDLRFPVGTLRWSYPTDWGGVPLLILDLLFRPQLLGRIIITWTGNVWLWLGFVALACAALLRRHAIGTSDVGTRLPGAGLMATSFLLMLCWGYDMRGGDGNYFIAGIASAIVLGVAAAWRRLAALHTITRNAFLLAMLAFALFQAGYSLLSATWNPGTRAFNLDFTRGAHGLREHGRNAFAAAGLAQIDAHLRSLRVLPRMIGCTPHDDTLGMELNASFEGIAQLAYARPQAVASAASFIEFLKDDRIDYLLAPSAQNSESECKNLGVLGEVVAKLDADPRIATLRDRGYVLYDLSALR